MKQYRVEVVDRTYAAILAAKTPAERAAMVDAAHSTARILIASGERHRHPEWTEQEIAVAVSRRLANATN